MNLFRVLGDLFKPAVELVDNLHTSDEERLQAKNVILTTQAQLLGQTFEYENRQLEARSRIIEAEAKSDNLLTSAWRPITMLTFLTLVVTYWFGYTPEGLSEERVADVFELIKWGLGGYVVGRSGEKIVRVGAEALKRKEET